jgi:nucleoside phosphorylase
MLGLSTILNAVKPSERTDQYVILGAMFALNAQSTPITAKQIKDALHLHLGSKIPVNINARLRDYGTYVEPAEKGPPLRWLLTPPGVEALRAMSGLELTAGSNDTGFNTDVGVVCALEQPEFEALMSAMGGPEKWKIVGSPRFPHVYRETIFGTDAGKSLRVVGTTSTSMGLTAAAIATTHLILQFSPRLIVMTGIAAGTRAGNRHFGDVLVADPSVDYNSGKVSFADGIREFLPDPYPIGLNPRLRSVLHKYRGDHSAFASIRGRWKGVLPPGANRVHIGPLGAADQVIDDESRIIEIQRNWRKLIGVEMETYGVYRACYESPDPKPRFVSFKAVCDFAAVKSDSWQQYAAFVAAEFTAEFLRAEWEALWPNN